MSIFISNTIDVKQIIAPASKSVAQRVLLASALSHQKIQINHIGQSDDVLNILKICKQLGAEVETINIQSIAVKGRVNPPKKNLNVGESGLGVRLTTPIASTFNQAFIINGKGSLLNRPLTQFKDFLPQMGVNVSFNNGHLPISISGKLKGGNYTVDGSLSSQYISGLLMALPLAKNDSVLNVSSPTSIPYIDITLEVLKNFSIEIENNNYTTFKIKGNQIYQPKQKTINIEGDWSGASFWIVYGLIKGIIEISNLNPNSTQADKAILKVINLVGGNYKWQNNTLIISSTQLKPFEFDATHCPDLFPPLVTLASAINGTSKIKGINRLTHKESNRAKVLQTEFKKLELDIELDDDIMLIKGTSHLKSAKVNSNNDHRIAMCTAIASVLTDDGIEISNENCVNKSYPEFWKLI